jgi:gamma-glutamyl-gamma-aminobutyrate hydrolase PuuD
MSAPVKTPRRVVFSGDEEAASMLLQVLLSPGLIPQMTSDDVQDMMKRVQRLVMTGGASGISFEDLFTNSSTSEQEKLVRSLRDGSLLLYLASLLSKNPAP